MLSSKIVEKHHKTKEEQQKEYKNRKHAQRQSTYRQTKKGIKTSKDYNQTEHAKLLRAQRNKRYYDKKKQQLQDFKSIVSPS